MAIGWAGAGDTVWPDDDDSSALIDRGDERVPGPVDRYISMPDDAVVNQSSSLNKL
jgi:hypothetical protein